MRSSTNTIFHRYLHHDINRIPPGPIEGSFTTSSGSSKSDVRRAALEVAGHAVIVAHILAMCETIKLTFETWSPEV